MYFTADSSLVCREVPSKVSCRIVLRITKREGEVIRSYSLVNSSWICDARFVLSRVRIVVGYVVGYGEEGCF